MDQLIKQLTASELDAIASAAWPLPPAVRAEFEQQCITELQKLPLAQRGEGTLHRTIAVCQRPFLGTIIGTGNIAAYGKAALRDKGK